MDPITALALAGTVITLVDFAAKLFSDTKKLYDSSTGALTVNVQLELYTNDLRALLAKLRDPKYSPYLPGSLTEQEAAHRDDFQKMCDGAEGIAVQLIDRLEALKRRDDRKPNVWDSFQAAVRVAWSHKEIEGLKKQLSEFRASVETRMLFSIREDIDAQFSRISSRFDRLDKQTQIIISSMLGASNLFGNDNIRAQINAQTLALSQLLSRMEATNHEEHRLTREKIIKSQDGGRRIENVEIVAGVEINVSESQETKLRSSIQKQITQSLKFDSMHTRYEEILDAHTETFEWVFHEPTAEQPPWSNFSDWLKTGKGVYWVSGKPGSGKSTLMKHIFDNKRRESYLRAWANDTPVCVATFFFWNSGTKEQRSQLGLYRALLFQVLAQFPELTPIILPEVWAKAYSNAVTGGQISSSSLGPWPLAQLEAAFKAFVDQNVIPLKTCLLIDGLDEFDGYQNKIASTFGDIKKSENVKACLSSRPWSDFSDAFENCASLRLQDLTLNDIKKFVKDRFHKDVSFQRLEAQMPGEAAALIKEMVDKADGVFLWVQIVVQSLLGGIKNRDPMDILLERLRGLPSDIEPLYQHLLERIEPYYLAWASKAFQIVRLAQRLTDENPFKLALLVKGHEQGFASLTLEMFYFAIDDKVDIHTIETSSQGSLLKKCNDLEVQLTARCASLLETSLKKSRDKGRKQSNIKWFHRTARDFIERNPCGSKLLNHIPKSKFSPNICMIKSCILELAAHLTLNPNVSQDAISKLLNSCLIYAYDADTHVETHDAQIQWLDKLDELMTKYWRGGRPWMSPFVLANRPRSLPVKEITFLHLAALYNLTGYIGGKMPRKLPKYNTTARSLLQLISENGSSRHGPKDGMTRMTRLLLELGADRDPKKRGWLHKIT